MTADHALTILTANAEWAAGVDVVRHYEDAAEAFYQDTGIMAPGKSRPMDWPDAGNDDRLAWATWCKARAVERLEAVRLLRADLAEAQATLANERGEGEPPCEGWATKRNPMLNDIPDNWWWERHLVMVFRRRDSGWDRNEYVPDRGVVVTSHPTARAAMMAPSAAKGLAK